LAAVLSFSPNAPVSKMPEAKRLRLEAEIARLRGELEDAEFAVWQCLACYGTVDLEEMRGLPYKGERYNPRVSADLLENKYIPVLRRGHRQLTGMKDLLNGAE